MSPLPLAPILIGAGAAAAVGAGSTPGRAHFIPIDGTDEDDGTGGGKILPSAPSGDRRVTRGARRQENQERVTGE
jgi:hypothetical protein